MIIMRRLRIGHSHQRYRQHGAPDIVFHYVSR